MRIITFVLVVFFLTLTNSVNASEDFYCDINKVQTKDFSEDMPGYYQDNYDKVFPEWLAKANSGEEKYQFYVAKAYQYGQGVEKDLYKSFDWYTRSSNQGYPVAKNNLSFFYTDGEFLEIDLNKHFQLLCDAALDGLSLATMNIAFFYSNYIYSNDKRVFEWLMKASMQGNVNAQNELALLYFNGNAGVKKSKEKAFNWVEKSAENGYDVAQNNLGWMYQNGEGTSINLLKAFEWYQKSAIQGNKDAQNNMGFMYESGNGVSQNSKKAFEWYEKSANQGYDIAQNNLGWMYQAGKGVLKDLKKAFYFYKKSALQENNLAQANLGFMYENGYGTPINYDLAFEWYLKASSQGNEFAKDNINNMYELRLGLLINPKKTIEWFEKFANAGVVEANTQLGYLFESGDRGVKKDINKAYEWYQKGANKGDALAQNSVGSFYEYGKVVDLNYSKAFDWYLSAANSGNSLAQVNVGYFYENGKSVEQNLDKAFEWYIKAANQNDDLAKKYLKKLMYKFDMRSGLNEWFAWIKKFANYGDADAQNTMGVFYSGTLEIDVIQDWSKAFFWYQKSANQGNQYGQSNLGQLYDYGKGVEQNFIKAAEWYEKSARQGNAQAQFDLSLMYASGKGGLNKDLKKAFELQLSAAQKGLAKAQNNVGIAYSNGFGVSQDYKKAFEWFKKAADQGDSMAQNNLGWAYQNGYGVVKDYEKAIELYEKSSEQGLAEALMNLSAVYNEGILDDKDDLKSAEYYARYKELTYLDAQENIINCKKTTCDDFDEIEAETNLKINENLIHIQKQTFQANTFTYFDNSYEEINELEILAKNGDPDAQAKLGVTYWWSQNETDKELALYWTKKAALNGNSEAQNNYGTFFYNGDLIAQDLSQSFYWYHQSVNQGNSIAMKNLGSYYFLIDNDVDNAIKYLKMAFNSGELSAAWSLGNVYRSMINVNKNNEYMAYEWMLKAAQKNYLPAQFEVSMMLLNGEGVQANKISSLDWLTKALKVNGDQNNIWVELVKKELTSRYFFGVGVDASFLEAQKIDSAYVMELVSSGMLSSHQIFQFAQNLEFDIKDLSQARDWYEKAAEKGHLSAQQRVGLLYSQWANPAGLIPDYRKAEFWFLKAIDQGDIDSMAHLAEMYYSDFETIGVRNKLYAPEKAFNLLIKAKDSGASNYHMGLQYLYQFGIGVEMDLDQAIQVIKDKLKIAEEWEKSYWYRTMLTAQIKHENPDKSEVSRSMNYFIAQAKLGNVKNINILAEMYLNEEFEYYDEKEAIYWLNNVTNSSFNANITLSEYAETYSEYGDYVIKAIELFENGKVEDFVSQTKIAEVYSSLAGYYRDIGAHEKVESTMRKLSELVPDQNSPYWLMQKMNFAGISENSDNSKSYLEDQIKLLENRTDKDSLDLLWFALTNLHMQYRDEQDYQKSVNIAIRTYNLVEKLHNNENLMSQIGLLSIIARDYLMLGEHNKAQQYFSIMKNKTNISQSKEYREEYVKGVNVHEKLKYIWKDIIESIILTNNGDYDKGFNGLNFALDQIQDTEIPLRRQDLDFALMPLKIFTDANEFNKASLLLSKVVNLYQQNVEKRITLKSLMSSDEKNNIRDNISEYIYISSLSDNPQKDKGFEVMQLASGLTLSDTVIKSISNKELTGTLLVKSKLLENLSNKRRSLIDEKFMKLDSDFVTLQNIDIKLNNIDSQINLLENDLDGKLGNTLDNFITPAIEVQDSLSNQDGLITMLFSNKRSHIWLITKDGVYRHDSEFSLNEVAIHANDLLKALDPSNINNSIFPITSSSALYDLLIKPFEADLEGIDRLIFSPDPVLSQIPFSILTKSGEKNFDIINSNDDLRGISKVKNNSNTKSNNSPFRDVNWLINDYAIAIIPSVYSYVGLEAVGSEEGSSFDNFIGIGNPLLSGTEVVLRSNEKFALNDQRGAISRTLQDLSALPETESELETIAKFFDEANVITQENATETLVRDMDLSEANVIAFATHALVSNEIDNLFEPAIVLTPVDSDNPENDGLLLASEVSELNLNADIVLLSACNTASSFDESNSQGLSGLADSFFEAGAKSLLASYWSVISDSAVDITTRMFERTNTGKTYSHKHRQSVLEILNEPNSFKSNPVYWAPFMVVGVN